MTAGRGWPPGDRRAGAAAPRCLFDTLVMLVLLAGGIGLVARAIRPRGGGRDPEA